MIESRPELPEPSLALSALASAALASAALAPQRALAHAADLGQPPEVLLRTFTADPFVLVPGALALTVAARGLVRIHRAGRLDRDALSRAAALALALLVSALAICTPLDALGAALFSAHMTQHLVLIGVAAPLFALARPGRLALWGAPTPLRRAGARALRRAPVVIHAARALGHPIAAFVLHGAALWAWHLPALYEAALVDDRVHALEHATMAGSAWLYWRALLGAGTRRGMGHGVAVLFAFGGALQGTVLGALLTVARAPWYRAHAGGPEAFGWTLLADQQLAGLLMWVPGGLVYLVAALVSFAAWLRASELAAARTDVLLESAITNPSSR